jgi:hypothetical protein
MADQPNDLATAAVRGCAAAGRAWMEAVNAAWLGCLDLPTVESGRTGFNQEFVVIRGRQGPITLHPEGFVAWDGTQLPAAAVSVVPSQVGAGEETEVCVRVVPPGGISSGTYTGSLLDSPGGTPLVDEVGVYVVGDPAD